MANIGATAVTFYTVAGASALTAIVVTTSLSCPPLALALYPAIGVPSLRVTMPPVTNYVDSFWGDDPPAILG